MLTSEERSLLQREALQLEYALALHELSARCKADFKTFVRVISPAYKMTWVHHLIATELQQLADGLNDNLIVNMPPGHGKSEIVSRLFPAWVFARDPDFSILAASATSDLATYNNRCVQQILTLPMYRELFPVTALPLSNARTVSGQQLRNSDVFEILGCKGSYRGAGVGALPSGIGARGLIADDLIKNDEQASSAVYRSALSAFWHTTFISRQRRHLGHVWKVLIMTRWREDDINGELIEKAQNGVGEEYRSIVLPAVRDLDDFEERPYDMRPVGAPLCPELGYDAAWANKTQATQPDSVWNGLYQQRPSIRGGGILKINRFKFWYPAGATPPRPYKFTADDGTTFFEAPQKELPKDLRRGLSSWDFAFKNTTESDFVAGTIWAYDGAVAPADSFIIDLFHERADINQSCEALKQKAAQHSKVREHLIEDKANGTAVEGLLQQTIAGLTLVNPDGGKIARAQAASVNLNAGNIYLPHPSFAPWVAKFLAELSAFPKGKKDDMVDSFSQAVNRIYGKPRWKFY